MKPKILLVEDDQDLGMVLKQYLEFSDFDVNWIPNPEEILKNKKQIDQYQLAILDVMLPVIDGFELSKEIRKSSEIPFLFLTAKGQSIDRILGLKLGADDYITKPCEPEELILRIKNILKRQQNSTKAIIKLGNYSFIPSQFQLLFHDETIQLTEKESELLLLLSKNNQKIINRKEILETLWGENDYFLGRSLDVFMTRLRKYFQKDDRIKFDSVRGIGFKIEFPE
ncbi:response regulator transcription factor [Epilithonimonas pallida]|uniref:DNA-binding response regulator, OmpR family, contains REC and winged-helix (WHTH) domain n=1 Tax=Epilithonimonas pallida TaxID=373671 RepID=A0ABY1R6L6_9FLAO|nr:response regulator transcription factor [Epilithonimonas pallida]SMP96913.1 DNA-binding response regulator, OmpR family, contains REC and winged-helix (wHTH) domain [Epilithonimonas pallida]